jgi:single-strand DNA-binding protein
MPLPTITLSGNLTQDPELRFTKNEKPVATLRVACSERKQENGQWVDGDKLYINVTCWNQTATNAAASLTKGDTVVLTGKLKQREYQANDGQTKTIYEIEADSIGAELRRFSYSKSSENSSWNPTPASGSTDNTIWGKSF